MRSYNKRYVAGFVIALGILGCMGGQGSTDGGSGADGNYRDEVYVGDDETLGTMELSVSADELAIGQTTGFAVGVFDASGQPVPEISVICDSEKGLAIIEPTTGHERTGYSGVMSGEIGCDSPGSFQLVCRLSIGANRRAFASVRCTGDVPSGFQGFPGSGGGHLGGGVQNNDDGTVQIIEAGFEDDGSYNTSTVSADASIDITQITDCDGLLTTPADYEPFFDTYINLKVQNNLAERVTFSYLTYSVQVNNGNEFESSNVSLTRLADSTLDESGDSGNIIVPIFTAYNGGKWVGNPLGRGEQFTTPGLKTVNVTLVGETASGELVRISAAVTGSFSNYDRCE
jgi:hypothetical protein